MSQRPMPKPLPKKPLPKPDPSRPPKIPLPVPPRGGQRGPADEPLPVPPREPTPPKSGPIYVPRPKGQIPPDPIGPFNPNDPNNPYKDDWNPSKWRTQPTPIGIPNIPQNTGVVPPWKEVIADSNNPRANGYPIGIPDIGISNIPQNTGIVPPWINGSSPIPSIPQNTGVVPPTRGPTPTNPAGQIPSQQIPPSSPSNAEILKKRMLEQKLKSQNGNTQTREPYFGPM